MDTRDAILDAAQQLIQIRGANGMSFSDISRVVGIRTASIHYHFPSKADLLSSLVSRYSEAFFVALDEAIDNADGALDKLEAYARVFSTPLRLSEDHTATCLCGMLASELASLEPRVATQVRDFYRDNTERLVPLLELGRAEGTMTARGDSRRLAKMVLSLFEGGLIAARLEDGESTFLAMVEELGLLLKA